MEPWMTKAKQDQTGAESEQSQNDTWGSPIECVELSRAVMSSIDLDPCGNPQFPLFAGTTILLPIYKGLPFTPGVGVAEFVSYNDSITNVALWESQENRFVNPPWSDIEPWIERMEMTPTEARLSFVGPARVNAGWFHRLRRWADLLWFPERRFMYRGATTQPPFHSFMAFKNVDPADVQHKIPQFFPKERDPFLVGLR